MVIGFGPAILKMSSVTQDHNLLPNLSCIDQKLKCYSFCIRLSLVVGLQQPTGHWFSMPFGRLSLVTVGQIDQKGPMTNTQECYNISAIILQNFSWH